MPSLARESTSLIILLLEAVSSSSSFTRSRIGAVWRCTYFLRAKGLILPQKPSWVSGCNAGLPLAPVVVVLWSAEFEVAAGWLCEAELVCCARTGRASTVLKSSARNTRFFIVLHPPISGEHLRAPLQHASTRVLRDFFVCVPKNH